MRISNDNFCPFIGATQAYIVEKQEHYLTGYVVQAAKKVSPCYYRCVLWLLLVILYHTVYFNILITSYILHIKRIIPNYTGFP